METPAIGWNGYPTLQLKLLGGGYPQIKCLGTKVHQTAKYIKHQISPHIKLAHTSNWVIHEIGLSAKKSPCIKLGHA